MEELGAQESVGGHAALRMADQPERLNFAVTDLVVNQADDILQVFVIGRRPDLGRSIWRGNNEAVFFLEIH